MRPSFHPRTINGPFDDPGLFVPFLFEKRAVLFDLGDTARLSSRDILKISHIFISHTHMDHFIGFDRVLRLFLGRSGEIHLFGPEGFLDNVEGKLSGYSWNLVENYQNRFMVRATEIRQQVCRTRKYACEDGFVPAGDPVESPFQGIAHQEPGFTVRTAVLDHGLPCLGFTLAERFHINILKDRLAELGLAPGPWLKRFKDRLHGGDDPETPIPVPSPDGGAGPSFSLGDLTRRIARITPGQRIGYITDVAGTPANEDRIVELVRGVDHLYIEAAFLEQDREIAREKRHLTAAQAGRIAARSGARGFTLFHFSPRYLGMEDRFRDEAEETAAAVAS